MKINWVDILIVVYIVRAFFHGKKRGLGFEITALVSALASWILALHFYQGLGQSFSKWFLLSLESARVVSFVGIAIGILFIGAILSRLLKKIMKLSFLPNIEKIGGYILGTLRGISVSAIIIVALALTPSKAIQQEVYISSFFGNYLVALSPKAHEWIWPKGSEAEARFNIKEFWGQLPERPKGEIL